MRRSRSQAALVALVAVLSLGACSDTVEDVDVPDIDAPESIAPDGEGGS